jgi:caffeoyl-CoA O-methyltransferase
MQEGCKFAGMEIILTAANAYALAHSTAPNRLLEEIHEFTLANHPEAHMISGPLQGRLLSLLSKMISPRRILEIGTFTGYSALCLAEGLLPDGELHTIEKRENDAATARHFFSRSAYAKQIQLHCGEAMKVLKLLNGDWDLVFLDADKTGYIAYYDLLLESMKPGSWIIADNVFFHGEVLKPVLSGKNAKAVEAFNKHVEKDPRVEQVMMTIRDGLSLIRIK